MVFVGIAVALFGWLPRLAIPLSWGVLAAMWFVVLIGDALHLPSWLLDLLPFSATPYQPFEPLTWTPLVAPDPGGDHPDLAGPGAVPQPRHPTRLSKAHQR